jgi:orotidine-5'-phosphate decarboxylase
MTSRIDVPLHRRLILALDTPDQESALDLVRRTRGTVGTFKVGLELFTATGPSIFKALKKEDAEIFLDLKLHDIPNTVAGAVRAAQQHGVSLLTVHASGGPSMLAAAQAALSGATAIPGMSGTNLLAVTALTSLTGKELEAVGFEGGPDVVVKRLASLASQAGLFGCVCSPEEASLVRAATRPDFAIVTPGIRAKDAGVGSVGKDDQARTATAFDAVKAGADYVVVGRPIRSAPDPAAAAAKLLEEIAAGLQARA